MDIENSKFGEIAEENFRKGYNCSQAVFLAFQELYGMDEAMAARLSSSFGGGMGRLREVCGYDTPGAQQEKAEHYKRVQELAKAYETENGSIVCRELLGLTEKRQEPTPEARTEGYYKKRPCPKLVRMAAAIMEQYIAEHPI